MRTILPITLFALLCFGCTGKQSHSRSSDRKDLSYISLSEIRDNPEARSFADAIIGNWESVFTNPNGDNIKTAEFTAGGVAKLEVTKVDTTTELIRGEYRIEFERKPGPNMVTLGQIVIKTESEEFILSRVWFGDHNGVMLPDKRRPLYLRVDKEPHGVLIKQANI